ncbi:hypothetical protein [Halotalea alkalilenta]|uniref:Uncharacterized protein n=1 Tax=Halotalea alkalilenta TaxID=376489 RepID=A0A172YGI2_9GAMM|nr:hypothetical protein [Halotalea alkalilenta]ANF58065.1 hypothetical protein A5892_11790 [Halotalea alkalilenta]
MFFTLLLATFVVALLVSYGVVKLFDSSINAILTRIINADISAAWHRYITFAAYVVGVSGGVRIYSLERYINPPSSDESQLALNAERWTLEIYRTVVGTLQSIAWMYLVVFLCTLIAFVVLRGFELRQKK